MSKNLHPTPPRLAERLLQWLAGPGIIEDLSGDLEELFYQELTKHSARRATFNYWRRVIVLGFSYGLRARRKQQTPAVFASSPFQPLILASYFRVAFRNLVRDKYFATMNIAGLAIGMSISLLLLALLGYVLQYDTFHEKRDNIYRIVTHTNSIEREDDWASSPAALHDYLRGTLPVIQEYVRLQGSDLVFRYDEKEFDFSGFYADPGFLHMFTFPLTLGNASTALSKPNSVLLTESTAYLLFGHQEAFGKIVLVQNIPYEVTGILKDHPKNSHLHFNFILPYNAWQVNARPKQQDWKVFNGSYQYLHLATAGDVQLTEKYLHDLGHKYFGSDPTFTASFSLQPLNDIVPGPELRNEAGPSWDLFSMSIFFVLTLLILLPACGNYAMVSISRALRRMKEIGIRKTVGSSRNQIALQFVLEAVVVALIALTFSFYLFTVIREEFVDMVVGGRESLDLSMTPLTLALFTGFTLIVGILSGIVPGLYFAKVSPLVALRNKNGNISRKFSTRKALLVVQFALSLGFIMTVVMIFGQYRRTLQYNFGFNQANVLDVSLQGLNPEIVQSEFSRLSSIESVSLSSHIIGTQQPAPVYLHAPNGDSTEVVRMAVDPNYIDNLGIRLLAGSNFSNEPAARGRLAIVNEEFLRKLGIQRHGDALGRSWNIDGKDLVVTGVVADFHYTSLREPIQPFLFVNEHSRFKTANVKIGASDPAQVLLDLETSWKSFAGDRKFEARFLDDEIEESYSIYFNMIRICGFLGLLATSISCLGLLGMVIFTVQMRVKEIGIRKVMGSTTKGLVILLSRDFVLLMLLGFLIATPLTYLFMEKVFLPVEHSKVAISFYDVLISLALLLAIGLTTVLSQTVKASQANPVDSLRSE